MPEYHRRLDTGCVAVESDEAKGINVVLTTRLEVWVTVLNGVIQNAGVNAVGRAR